MMRTILCVCLLAALQACSGEDPDASSIYSEPEGMPDAQAQAKRAIAGVSRATVTALGERDLEALSQLVHPVDGVRFSPYGFVDPDSDRVLTATELVSAGEDSSRYLWGYYDGSGEPISLTFNEYYERFVYDADFSRAERTGYDTQIGVGNSINNAADVYPGCITVEYHFSGFDPEMQGLDWRSLRLVFSRYTDNWYLVGIVHDEWTI